MYALDRAMIRDSHSCATQIKGTVKIELLSSEYFILVAVLLELYDRQVMVETFFIYIG